MKIILSLSVIVTTMLVSGCGPSEAEDAKYAEITSMQQYMFAKWNQLDPEKQADACELVEKTSMDLVVAMFVDAAGDDSEEFKAAVVHVIEAEC